MLKTLVLGLFLSFYFSTIFAQEEEIVNKIRQTYIEYNKQITESEAEGLDFLPPRFKINNVQNRPALGPVNISITYYYDEHSTAEEPEDFSDMKKKYGVLRKVVYTEGMPSYTDYKETLYDEKGNLLFYYVKTTGYNCNEKRFYFNKGKLIKIKFNPIKDEKCTNYEESPSFTRYAGKLTKEDLNWEERIIKRSINDQKTLKNLYDSTR